MTHFNSGFPYGKSRLTSITYTEQIFFFL